MKHYILGLGNLGRDIMDRADKEGHEVNCPIPGWRFAEHGIPPEMRGADIVWNCVGFGSVKESLEQFREQQEALVALPVELMMSMGKKQTMFHFSTDYVAHEQRPSHPDQAFAFRSAYAINKLNMEGFVYWFRQMGHRVRAIRVSSLYGQHFPDKTFPGKVKQMYSTVTSKEDKPEIKMPINQCTPTPTHWLAKFLFERLSTLMDFETRPFSTEHCAPSEPLTYADWAQLVLGEEVNVRSEGWDSARPQISNLQCSFASSTPKCIDLWNEYKGFVGC